VKFVLKIIDSDGQPLWYWHTSERWMRDKGKAEYFASADDARRMMEGLEVVGVIEAVEVN
jgi:hypothetical protein